MKLEKMDEFFDSRLSIYEEHQLHAIHSANLFYPFTASQLPTAAGCHILDLGCGTGLELDAYFKINPFAAVTGIDLAEGMLKTLQAKFPNKELTLIRGSYFDVPLGENRFDAAVSVESLHHFTQEQKISLYHRLHRSLKDGGYFILTDYLAETEEEEKENFRQFLQLKKESVVNDNDYYHFDTPLTREHETEALLSGGFSKVELLNSWRQTYTLKAYK